MKINNRKVIILILLIILIITIFLHKIYINRRKYDNSSKNDISASSEYYANSGVFGVKRWGCGGFILTNSRFSCREDMGLISRLDHIIDSQISKNKKAMNRSNFLLQKLRGFFNHSGHRFKLYFESLKEPLLNKVKPLLNYDHFSLVGGMVFGDISTMSDGFKQDLKIIGMLHVVSASGYNISLLLSLFGGLFRKFFSRKTWFFLGVFLVYSYALMTGWQPAIIRAALMSTSSLLASLIFYRQYKPLWGLIWTVIIMLSFNFEYLESISFQFSILSTLGIIAFLSRGNSSKNISISFMLSESLEHQISIGEIAHKSAVFAMLKDSLLVTLAAQAFVWPVVLIHFGEISLISLVANTFLLWLTPLITVIGLFLLIVSLFSMTFLGYYFAMILSFFTWTSVHIFEFASDFLGQFEWGVIKISGKISWWVAIIWWAILILYLVFINRRRKKIYV